MQIQIHPQSGVPIYLQLLNQVKYLVASGRLQPGEELPPIRALAEQLLINPNTVARAYLEMEREGMVVKRQGAGTYVAEAPPEMSRSQRRKVLAKHVDSLLAEAGQMGFELEDVLEVVRERHTRMVKA